VPLSVESLEVRACPAGDIFSASVIEIPHFGFGITALNGEQLIVGVGNQRDASNHDVAYMIRVDHSAGTFTATILPQTLGVGDYRAIDISDDASTIAMYWSPDNGRDHGVAVVNGMATDIGSTIEFGDTRALAAANGGTVGGFSGGGSSAVVWNEMLGLRVQPGFPAILDMGAVQGLSLDGGIAGGFGVPTADRAIRGLVWNGSNVAILSGSGSFDLIRDVSTDGRFYFGASAVFDPLAETEVLVATRFAASGERTLMRNASGAFLLNSELWGGVDNGWAVGAGPDGVFLWHESWTQVRYIDELLKSLFNLTLAEEFSNALLDVRAEIQFDGRFLNIVAPAQSVSYAIQIRVTTSQNDPLASLTGTPSKDKTVVDLSDYLTTSRITIDTFEGADSVTIVGVAARPIHILIRTGSGNDKVFIEATGEITVEAELGAGNDRYVAMDSTAMSIVHGGDGNDKITGSSLFDMLFGELGNDMLKGLGGGDTLDGGPGRNKITP
jgi:hypothetical protein